VLVGGLMVFFSMVGGSSTVRVRREFVKFGSPLMRVVWHGALSSIYRSFQKGPVENPLLEATTLTGS
jgi:hypothetical protein